MLGRRKQPGAAAGAVAWRSGPGKGARGGGGGDAVTPSVHAQACYPSRWLPFNRPGRGSADATSVKIVDYLVVKKRPPSGGAQRGSC